MAQDKKQVEDARKQEFFEEHPVNPFSKQSYQPVEKKKGHEQVKRMLDTQMEEIKGQRKRDRILNEKEFGVNKKILQEVMGSAPNSFIDQESFLFN